MKARTKTARWLLIALLFGFMAVAGLTLVHRHGSTSVAASSSAAPTPARLQQPDTALVASIGEQHTLPAAATGLNHEMVPAPYSYSQPQHATGHPGAPENASSGSASSGHAADPTSGSSGAVRPQVSRPATSATSPLPQGLGNSFAYNGYTPLDCELPAGCGVGGGMGYVSHQPSGTSGGQPITHDSQGSSPPSDGSGPPTSGSTPQASNDSGPPIGNTGGGSGTPGNSSPTSPGPGPVASAPELDPATLAGALTLLLGSLVVLRSRRTARATR